MGPHYFNILGGSNFEQKSMDETKEKETTIFKLPVMIQTSTLQEITP